ncbi:c-type cytochrome domain-containing protein [Planctomicrobium sp. SH668]|uniref:WD40 domain-containing protein n=1 Tax=Planctomicrobium sp. SH668 TaxID=3448126 RepID=UPI003F5B1486
MNRMKTHATLFAVAILGAYCTSTMADDTPDVSFRNDIAPILLNKCAACHGPKKAEGGYRVDTFEELLKAGDSGESPIASSPEHVSELLRRIISDDESERMPADADPLTSVEIDLVKRWLAAGGKFDGEDSAQPLTLVIPPPQYAAPPESYVYPLPVTALIFSPNGKQIITGGYHEVTIWDSQETKLARRISNLGQRIFALALSPDGTTLAVGCGEPGRNGEVRLINLSSGIVDGVVARVSDVVLDLAFRPGSNELAIASADGTIRIVNVESKEQLQLITSHADWVTSVAWSDDGSRLASTSRDKSVKVYDGTTRELISSYPGHGAATRGVSFLPDHQHVVSVGSDNKLHRWSVDGATKVTEIGLGGEAYKLTRSGTTLLVPCANKRLLQIDLTKNAIANEYKGHNDSVLAACFQPVPSGADSVPYIASGAFDGEIRLWNPTDGLTVRNWIAKP